MVGKHGLKNNEINTSGITVWFTGLPSSGKSTLAAKLAEELRLQGKFVEVLDGDEVRQRLTKDLGFTKEDRNDNVRRIAYLAKLLTRNGVITIVAAIAPYSAIRAEVRNEIGAFLEIYVKCDISVCIERDVKGLYKLALKGDILNFTGISDPYEPPQTPEVIVETDKETPDQSISKIMEVFKALGYIQQVGEAV